MNEKEILTQAAHGDDESMDIVIKQNTPLVWSVVRRFMNRGYDVQDLFQIGSIGLLKAVRRFNFEYGVKFSTYAVPLIMGEIRRFLRDDGMIKVSRHYKELAAKAASAREVLELELGREPTVLELSQRLGVCANEISEAQEACRSWDSIYSTVHDGENRDVYLIDKLRSAEDSEKMTDMVALKCAIAKLNDREKQIISQRYFDGRTQCDVAKSLGISQVQVSRTEKKVLNQLRQNLKECV